MDDAAWEQQLAAVWASIDEYTGDDPDGAGEVTFRALIDALAAELSPGSAIADFERACAFDSTGHSERAVPLYRQALATGLVGLRRRRAVIQMSSSLRNLGDPQTGVDALTAELAATSDDLDDAATAVLALCLTDLGREREAVSIVIAALAAHLPRYQRSMANYARALLEPSTDA